MLTSIRHHYLGSNYQRDYETKEQFNEDMKKEHAGNDEICWALLFTDKGEKVAEYHRGEVRIAQSTTARIIASG